MKAQGRNLVNPFVSCASLESGLFFLLPGRWVVMVYNEKTKAQLPSEEEIKLENA